MGDNSDIILKLISKMEEASNKGDEQEVFLIQKQIDKLNELTKGNQVSWSNSTELANKLRIEITILAPQSLSLKEILDDIKKLEDIIKESKEKNQLKCMYTIHH